MIKLVGGENIISTDTDSIIYAIPNGASDPLNKEGGSLGPKTYCYKEELSPDEEKVVRKAKGVTINSEVDRKITFEAMKRMVDEALNGVEDRSMEEFGQFTMKRDKDHNVYAVQMKKQFRFTFNKRRVLPDGSTLPFGYCD
ncbi:hypothetical protein B9Z55_027728 [Caenorhabditis nigoni]|nr:hypothetical protein B9Z55_027728 [Caenorhabditis nigoni]